MRDWAFKAAADHQVFEEFFNRRDLLRDAVEAIITNALLGDDIAVPVEDENESGAREGKLLYRAHRTRERNSTVVKSKKAQALERDRRLICEVCGFDFQRQYGLPKPFIECHHIVPLAKLRPGQRTRLSDLALVCANCHRALHRMPDPSDLNALRIPLTTG